MEFMSQLNHINEKLTKEAFIKIINSNNWINLLEWENSFVINQAKLSQELINLDILPSNNQNHNVNYHTSLEIPDRSSQRVNNKEVIWVHNFSYSKEPENPLLEKTQNEINNFSEKTNKEYST